MLTNSVPVAMELSGRREIELLLCGGQVRHGDGACAARTPRRSSPSSTPTRRSSAPAGSPRGRAHRLLPGRGGGRGTDHRAHRRLLRAGRLQQARRHRRAPGLPLDRVTAVLTDDEGRSPAPTRRSTSAGVTVRRASGPQRRPRQRPAHAVSPARTTASSPGTEDADGPWPPLRPTRRRRRAQQYGLPAAVRPLPAQLRVVRGGVLVHLDHHRNLHHVAFVLAMGGPRGIWTWPIVIVGQTLVALSTGHSRPGSRCPATPTSGPRGWRTCTWAGGWLDVVRVPVHRHRVGGLRPGAGGVPAAHRRGLHADERRPGDARRARAPGRADHRLHPRHHPGQQHRSGHRGDRHRRPHRAADRRRRHPRPRALVQPGFHGVVPAAGYYSWLGPFMLATLLGAYTIVGFESASNLAEETFEPHKTVPRAMVRAVVLSGVVGMAFLSPWSTRSIIPAAVEQPRARGATRRRTCSAASCRSLPDLRLRLDLRLRAGDHGHQRPHDLVDVPGPAAARLPALAPGAQGHRRARPGPRPRRGARRADHPGAAHPHLGPGHPVHRLDHHAGPAVRVHRAAVRLHRAAAPRPGRALLPRPVRDTGDRRGADLARLRADRPDRPERVPRRPVLRARRARRRLVVYIGQWILEPGDAHRGGAHGADALPTRSPAAGGPRRA